MYKWDIRFLRLAREVSTWSKDPSTKVGAVITDPENRVVSLGYNGFPRHIHDDEDLYADRDQKYKRVVHAEQNAILFAEKKNLYGCTLYTYPIPPCLNCTPFIIQTGIRKIVTIQPTVADSRYKERMSNWTKTKLLFDEAYIDVEDSITI